MNHRYPSDRKLVTWQQRPLKNRGGAQAFRQALEAGNDLVKALTATEEDSINETIGVVNEEIKKLEALKYSLGLMKRAAASYKHGKPVKAPRGSKKKQAASSPPAQADSIVDKIQTFLDDGPANINSICTAVKVSTGVVLDRLKSRPDLFLDKGQGLWKLK